MNFRRRLTAALAIALAAAALPATAASSSQNFNVTVNLSSVCAITAAPTDVAFTYASFQAAASTATGGAFSVRCTNLLPYTLALDATSGTVIGLNYSLALSAPSGTGNGAAQAFSISGTMAAGQSGDCATASCSGTQPRQLTITY